jgi:hypothetical protein
LVEQFTRPQKWEYAYVIYDTNALVIRYARTGERREMASSRDNFNATVRSLGEEGWELVGVSAQSEKASLPSVTQETLYFKRVLFE